MGNQIELYNKEEIAYAMRQIRKLCDSIHESHPWPQTLRTRALPGDKLRKAFLQNTTENKILI